MSSQLRRCLLDPVLALYLWMPAVCPLRTIFSLLGAGGSSKLIEMLFSRSPGLCFGNLTLRWLFSWGLFALGVVFSSIFFNSCSLLGERSS